LVVLVQLPQIVLTCLCR